jgi:transposase
MSRALRRIGARRGRPRPRVRCPWAKAQKQQCLEEIRAMLKGLPADHAAVYLDEVDVHLNPKIGLDWMNRGVQKEVMTPGSNVKRYLCGAMDARSGLLCWVKGEKKNSLLFVGMLRKLARETYADAKVIHVILDNYRIHSSKISREALAELEGRVVLHFLPPYCPDDNKIERAWLDLHANVTRNHRCTDMKQLMREVVAYLVRRNHRKKAESNKSAKAA